MLTKLEANWVYLEKQLLDYVSIHQPNLVTGVAEWLTLIRPLPIAEKTLYFAQITEPFFSELTTIDERNEWQKLKNSLVKAHKVRDVQILDIFEKTIDDWIQVVRKEDEIS